MQPELVFIGLELARQRRPRKVLEPGRRGGGQPIDLFLDALPGLTAEPRFSQLERDGFEPPQWLGMERLPCAPEGIVCRVPLQDRGQLVDVKRGNVAAKQVPQEMQRRVAKGV